MRRLLDLLGRRAPPFDAPLAPAEPLAVVGDVHGRLDLLDRLLGRLAAEAPGHRVVLVGDLVDRGEDSRGVLERAMALEGAVVLRGNHEAMLLGFLADPGRQGRLWLRNGGLQTLASFGIGGVGISAGPEALGIAAERLEQAMGPAVLAWLAARPLWWRSGNVAVTHAGADPRAALEDQAEDALLWGHPRWGREARADGVWVARGHVIREEAVAEAGRIEVDTGAFATGRLSAALVEAGGVRFVAT